MTDFSSRAYRTLSEGLSHTSAPLSAAMSIPGTIPTLLKEKTLTDVVKGIRASKRDTTLYISSVINEIKRELKSTDPFTKANALQKITFLQMMGYDMSWASFNCLEVMSQPRFGHKRVGYLAACQCFDQDTEVVLLCTNLLKKELRTTSSTDERATYEAGLALNCLSNIATADLARDLLPEVTRLTSHPSPYLRKKAVSCLFKMFVRYPQGLRLTFDRVRRLCTEDPDPSVVSCAVNVVTELSDKNPRNYLDMAPAFFNLLTTSSNNWMLIKVTKLLGSLVSEEPRLARKLLEPLRSIVEATHAKSLLYEAVYTVTLALPHVRKADGSVPASVPGIVALCARTLRSFVEEEDQNLKYLGLVGLQSLRRSAPRVLRDDLDAEEETGGRGKRPRAPMRDLVLRCLSDEDVTIRTRALDLLDGMATRRNLVELVGQLLRHVDLADGAYKADLVRKIVDLCRSDRYARLSDFEWYAATLVRLARAGSQGLDEDEDDGEEGDDENGVPALLRGQTLDVALRVLPARCFLVTRLSRLLVDNRTRRGDHNHKVVRRVLSAAAFVVGEYGEEHLRKVGNDDDPDAEGPHHALILSLLDPTVTSDVDAETRAVFVQSALKVLAAACGNGAASDAELEACVRVAERYLPIHAESSDRDVQERAFVGSLLLKRLGVATNNGDDGEDDDENVEQEPPVVPTKTPVMNNSTGNTMDDLLSLSVMSPTTTTTTTTSAPTLPQPLSSSSSTSSLASRCRAAASTLKYLLVPDPMKPVSAKVQRKIAAEPPTGLDVTSPLNTDALGDIWKLEREHRVVGPEEVSFTGPPPRSDEMNGGGGNGGFVPNGGHHPELGRNDASFPRVEDEGPARPTSMLSSSSSQQQRLNDPFYLQSTAPTEDATNRATSNFGIIQLDDVDDDEPKGKKKKKKNKKESKKKRGDASAIADNDVALLTGFGGASTNTHTMNGTTTGPDLTILGSDDEDDDVGVPRSRTKRAQAKEFSGLAKVDLTTPLREDEVMPTEPQHRQVEPRRTDANEPRPSKKNKKEKKPKKKGKKKRDKPTEDADGGAATDNLLDFGGLFANTAPAPNATNKSSPSKPIDSAFDDLLGLEAPAPTPIAPPTTTTTTTKATTSSSSSKQKKNSSKRPWIKCSVKASSAKGASDLNWSDLSVRFRARHDVDADGRLVSFLSLRVINDGPVPARDLVATFRDGDARVSLGTAAAGGGRADASAETTAFAHQGEETATEIKGALRAGATTVPLKLVLPATAHLSPEPRPLARDDVSDELADGAWASGDARVTFSKGGVGRVRPTTTSWFRARAVDGDDDDAAFALAARSANGCRVRVMVKAKEKDDGTVTANIDVRCSGGNGDGGKRLCKRLVSDLKRLLP